jgi:hypothetical protein
MSKNITELKLNEVQKVTGGYYATMTKAPAPTNWSMPAL